MSKSRIGDAVKVTLTCRCRIKVRVKPYRPTAKYVCPSNQGHPYSQIWYSYEDNGMTFENPAFAGA